MLNTRIYAEIDLGAIRKNCEELRRHAGGAKLLLPIKSDGYGHGAVEISRFVQERGLVDMFGVATIIEGRELRDAGITLPILNLGLILPDDESIDMVIAQNITQTVADMSLAAAISARAGMLHKAARLHLKVDTGMGRIGCPIESAADVAEDISRLPNVQLEGLFSHFPVSDDTGSDFTARQIEAFKGIVRECEARGVRIPLKHLANSTGLLYYPESHLDMVRPGIMAYGYYPSPECRRKIKLCPSMTLKSTVVFSKRVKAGTPLSYGLTYRAPADCTIATVPVGYGDGYSRFLSNRGRVIIRGAEYPVVGRVCMDQLMVNLGDDEYPVGEEVVLFGKGSITADTLAEWIGTIPYEIVCLITKRVPRTYVNG